MKKNDSELLQWLDEEFKKNNISNGLNEIKRIATGKTGKIEIVYNNPTELSKDKDKIIEVIKKLAGKGIKLDYNIVGRRIKLIYILSTSRLLKEKPLAVSKIQPEYSNKSTRRKVLYTVENMRIHQEILKNDKQPVMKLFPPERFYDYFEDKFLVPLSDLVDTHEEYYKFSERVLLQAYKKSSIDELNMLFSISIKELKERKDKIEHERILDSFIEQLKDFIKNERQYSNTVKLINRYIKKSLMKWPITDSFIQLIGRFLDDIPKLNDIELLPYILRVKELITKHKEDIDPAKGLLEDLNDESG
ncbi:hypothetical protein J7J26_03290 [Candidatus Micrarchaeota archaeon]|nr:hypothetical protein [Candidatus Micrarchaeota archaeon]